MTDTIKSMQLYPRPERILDDLAAQGYARGPVSVEVLNRLDQLHYHGTEAVAAACQACGIGPDARVLEVGAGWGGCARYIAHATGAHVTAIELQTDYNSVARSLTERAGLAGKVTHTNGDFLTVDLPEAGFDHAVSWLALFHIPDRPRYLSRVHDALRPGGSFHAEDLFLLSGPEPDEAQDFRAHLFPNSLVPWSDYHDSMHAAGFQVTESTDMTADWTAFTAERLAAFRANRSTYEAVHGPQGYQIIETFYDKMAGYFARGLVGGIRFTARKAG